MKRYLKSDWIMYLIILGVVLIIIKESLEKDEFISNSFPTEEIINDSTWVAPSLFSDQTLEGKAREMVMYGEDLIAHTAKYLGPNGSVKQISNGMNCQNCHLDAGTRPWGNNYGAVASTYPKFRERSGVVEGISKRVNDCLQRSLNGQALDTTSYEMLSIIAYMKWLGQNVPKGEKPKGVGLNELPYLDRPANAANGTIIFKNKCTTCHGDNGQGLKNANDTGYFYPPLWGDHSYNTGAGLFRLSRFAGYVKDNMPYNQASHKAPALSNEEAWDVAAFVNSQPRPNADLSKDWPNISAKPFDHPFGPYTDGFNEQQHKYGPYEPIVAKKKEMKKQASALENKTSKK